MEKFIQAIELWFMDPQNKKPASFFEIRNPIDARECNIETGKSVT